MEEAAQIGPNICPRCGASVVWPNPGKASGFGSGVVTLPDGTKRGESFPHHGMACKNCLIDLTYWTTWEDAKAREFYWEMRELGPNRGSFHEEKKWRDAVLAPQLQAHADRAQVMDGLGLKFADLSVGGSERAELKKWLFFDEVNDAADRYPGIFFHMGPFAMTWLFFDPDNRLQGCFIRPT